MNNFYNETLVAACVNVDDNDRERYKNKALCHRRDDYTICGCATMDRCNSPQAPITSFTFVNTPVLEDCELVPPQGNQDMHSFCCYTAILCYVLTIKWRIVFILILLFF